MRYLLLIILYWIVSGFALLNHLFGSGLLNGTMIYDEYCRYKIILETKYFHSGSAEINTVIVLSIIALLLIMYKFKMDYPDSKKRNTKILYFQVGYMCALVHNICFIENINYAFFLSIGCSLAAVLFLYIGATTSCTKLIALLICLTNAVVVFLILFILKTGWRFDFYRLVYYSLWSSMFFVVILMGKLKGSNTFLDKSEKDSR